jgi:hypothetical protein
VAGRLIPERTIDGWMTSALVAADAAASVWLPTPRRQANGQPWDMEVGAFDPPAKLLVYENKALAAGPAVFISLDQLLAYLDLWRHHHYFFYALPALSHVEVEKASAGGPSWEARLRREPTPFGVWMRVLTPLDVLWVLSQTARSSLRRRIDDAIRTGAEKTGGTGRIPTDYLTAYPSLNDHLRGAVECKHGRLIASGDTGAVVGSVLPKRQRVQTVGAFAAALLAERPSEPPSDASFRERLGPLDAMADDRSVGSESALRGEIASHLGTTTWVTLRVS